MKVFVTGATGNVGSALVQELLSAGHAVVGLTRSDAGADKLKAVGAEPLKGTLQDLDLLKKASTQCDAVAHLAFNHGFSDFLGSCETDRAAISAMASAMAAAGGEKALVITSGTMMLEKGRTVSERDIPITTEPMAAARGASEGLVLKFVDQGVRAMVMRFPPVVHGHGSLGFVQMLAQPAQKDKSVSYVGSGDNRWSAVHTLDAARAFRLALEKGEAGGVFHAVAEEGVAVKDIAHVVGETLHLPVASKTPQEAQAAFGMVAHALAADNPSTSETTRRTLGWTPVEKELLDDIKDLL